jgi:methyl-accepting chemotaxis protein
MRHWTIGKRLVIGFFALVIITVGLGSFGFVNLTTVTTHTAQITDDALPGVGTMGQVKALISENYGLTAWHIASTDANEVTAIESRMKESSATITKLYAEFEKKLSRPRDRQLFEAIAGPRAEYSRVRNEQVLPLSRALKDKDALALYRGAMTDAYNKYIAAVDATFTANKEYGQQESAAASAAAASAKFGLVAGMALAALLAAAIGLAIVRSTNAVLRQAVTELSTGAQQVASASGQVSGASQTLSEGATQQAASLEETSASMEEMASMTRQNAENSQQAATMMADTERLVDGANHALQDMVGSMTAIKESSDKVAKIIKTIDEIAFQTNILALNAAVEAARAGEAGMGFAVVADEVRALAQRSAQAAKDTAALIEESIARSNEGQQKVQGVTSTIQSITTSTGKVKGLVDQVSEASRQQAQGIDQVSQAIAQMEKVTQSTAATAEESAAASEELNAQAATSMQVVGRLAALVGQSVAAPRGETQRPRAARQTPATVLSMRAKKPAAAQLSAEEQIPLADTGTYGSF